MNGRAWARFWAQGGARAGLLATLALILLAALAPLFAPQNPSDPLGFDPLAANRPPSPSWTYLLGADARGRSVLALLLWGGRVSLAIGAGAAALAALVGVALGLLACWRGGALDPALSLLMDVAQAAPPLLVLLVLTGRLGGVPVATMLAVFALTGWVAPARQTRAAVLAGLSAPRVEAARAVGVGGARLVIVHLLPDALGAVVAWTAAAAAAYVALEAGLDFLGLGLPSSATSWGTALDGAQDALAAGNWWWMTFGGLALAAATIALGAVARGIARAVEPDTAIGRVRAHREGGAADEPAPALTEAWATWQPPRAAQEPRGPARRIVRGALLAVALVVVVVGLTAQRAPAHPLPSAAGLLRAAHAYPLRVGQPSAYIATATYAATAAALAGRQIPWAAWGACPPGLHAATCAASDVQLWYGNRQGRAQAEGSTFICTPRVTWGMNAMAGLATTSQGGCGPLGPRMGGLGVTAGTIGALLPGLDAGRARVLGQDVAAGRRCWVVTLGRTGRVCVDAGTGLPLRVEWLDRFGLPVASYTVTSISFGLDLAPQIFANPIPGGRGPLVTGLTQPLLDIQSADDFSLFTALVPAFIPRGLVAQTPTFDSFYDTTRGYAPQQRVRQAYQDAAGSVALVLVETTPGSAWDVTPPRVRARRIVAGGHALLAWDGERGQPALVRRDDDGTAALVSSRSLPVTTLAHVAAGLR